MRYRNREDKAVSYLLDTTKAGALEVVKLLVCVEYLGWYFRVGHILAMSYQHDQQLRHNHIVFTYPVSSLPSRVPKRFDTVLVGDLFEMRRGHRPRSAGHRVRRARTVLCGKTRGESAEQA